MRSIPWAGPKNDKVIQYPAAVDEDQACVNWHNWSNHKSFHGRIYF